MSRRLTTLFSLFCIALIAWFLARATFALRETALETSGSASRLAENAAAAPEPLAAFDGITTRNLLGVSVFPPEARRSQKAVRMRIPAKKTNAFPPTASTRCPSASRAGNCSGPS